MDVLNARTHGILDYVIVVFLLLAPTLFGVTGGLAALAYVLAVAHLTMTLLTDFPLGMVEVISLGVHGVVELVAAIVLIVVPWIMSDAFLGARVLYTVIGVVLFALWLLTDYSPMPASSKTSRRAT